MSRQDTVLIRKRRVRAKVFGTEQRPRLSVRVSLRHISAQLIDDTSGKTIAAKTTVGVKTLAGKTMTEKATWLGEEIGQLAKKKKITTVVFDRGSKKYHGRIAALAEAARQTGLQF